MEYRFKKCKKCLHPIRIVDIHGKTIDTRCYYQIDTMKEWWDEEDCAHFFEPKVQVTSERGEYLASKKNTK